MQRDVLGPFEHSFAHAIALRNPSAWLLISGQVPEDSDGIVPETFTAQARAAWRHIERRLQEAGMTLDHLVKVTTYLSDRRFREENFKVRHEVLQHRHVAVTVIIADIYDPAWLLEIEAVAAA